MTKYRVGDEVTLRGVIKRSECSHRIPLLVTIGNSELWFSESDIVTHTPKQREFKPGDMVTWAAMSESVYTILAIDDDVAWLKNNPTGIRYSSLIEDIRHADEAE